MYLTIIVMIFLMGDDFGRNLQPAKFVTGNWRWLLLFTVSNYLAHLDVYNE